MVSPYTLTNSLFHDTSVSHEDTLYTRDHVYKQVNQYRILLSEHHLYIASQYFPLSKTAVLLCEC